MVMEPELYMQQCRIFQNKDKELIVLPYAGDLAFYQGLDAFVLEGRKIKIIFSKERLEEGSYLIERLISCLNGDELFSNSLNIYNKVHDVLGFSSHEELNEVLGKYLHNKNKLFNAYLVKYDQDAESGGPCIYLEPAGEGLPSYSFEIDI